MGSYGSVSVLISSSGSLWILIGSFESYGFFGSVWVLVLMGPYEFLWVLMGSYGFL